VLQSLTQQLINERAEKGELQEMLQQEGHELEAAVAATQELQAQLGAAQQQVCKPPLSSCDSMHISAACQGS
jgi:hypothetical protein